jgi:hypothetical protein
MRLGLFFSLGRSRRARDEIADELLRLGDVSVGHLRFQIVEHLAGVGLALGRGEAQPFEGRYEIAGITAPAGEHIWSTLHM